MIETLADSEITVHQGNVVVATLGNNNQLTLYNGDLTLEGLVNFKQSSINVSIYKGNLTAPKDNGMFKYKNFSWQQDIYK